MKQPAVDCVLDCRAALGEAAVWSVREQALFFTDITGGVLWRFEPESGASRTWDMGGSIGCFALRPGGAVVALEDGFFDLAFGGGAPTRIGGPTPGAHGHRFNDGTVDPRGRFYAGTMPKAGAREGAPEGALYRVDGGGAVHKVRDGYFVINGMAFAPDGRTAYVSDSFPSVRTIWAYDYDVDSAAWRNKRVFFDTRAVAGRPDGGTVDADGCYWMAGVGGWQLVRLTPDGAVDLEIAMPVEKPTKIAFGGRDLDVLYVTSIGAGGITTGPAAQPQAGGVFALRVPGVQGTALPDFAG